jgi:hypothetical protein
LRIDITLFIFLDERHSISAFIESIKIFSFNYKRNNTTTIMKFLFAVLALPAACAFTGPSLKLQTPTLQMSSNDYLGNLQPGLGAPPGVPQGGNGPVSR